MGLTYAYTEANFTGGSFASGGGSIDIAGKTVPLVPRDKVTANVHWYVNERAFMTFAFRYVGEQYMDNDEPNDFYTKIPAYSVLDLKYSHQFGAWQAGLVVNNLLDEKYYTYAVRSTASDAYSAYPLPERTVTVFAQYTFGK